ASDCAELRVDDGAQLADGAVVLSSSSLMECLRAKVVVGRTPTTSDRVRAVIGGILPAISTIGGDEDMRGIAAWDSLTALRVVVALENELGVELPYDLFAAPRTLDSVAAIVRGAP